MELLSRDEHYNSEDLKSQAVRFENEAANYTGDEREEKLDRARSLRGASKLNKVLEDVPLIGWFLSEIHYDLSSTYF